MFQKIMAYSIILIIVSLTLLVCGIAVVGLFKEFEGATFIYYQDNLRGQGTLGELETIKKEYESLEINELLARFKSEADATLGLSLALRFLDEWNFDDALEITQQVIDSSQSLDDAFAVQGLIYYRLWRHPIDEEEPSSDQHHLNQALESLKKALEIHPKHREARCLYAVVLARFKNFDDQFEEEINIINQVLQEDDRLAIAYLYRGNVYGELVMNLINDCKDPERGTKIANDYKKAMFYNPENGYPYYETGHVIFWAIYFELRENGLYSPRYRFSNIPKDRCDFINNCLANSISYLSESLTRNPKHYPSHIFRACCFEIREQYDLAIRDLHVAYEIRPTFSLLFDMIRVCRHLKDIEGIHKYGQKIIQIAPKNKDAYLFYASQLLTFDTKQQAMVDLVDICDQGLAIAPDYGNLYAIRGLGYRMLQEDAKAVEDLKRALELGTTIVPDQLSEGIEYYQQHGKFDEDW